MPRIHTHLPSIDKLKLLIDPKNVNCYNHQNPSESIVYNLVSKNNLDVDPTTANQSYSITAGAWQGGSRSVSLIGGRANEGYFSFGLSLESPETFTPYDSFTTSQNALDRLQANDNTICGNSFGHDRFVEHDNHVEYIDHLCQYRRQESIPEYDNINSYVGYVPKESSFMMWIWVSDELNNSSQPAYISSGQQGNPDDRFISFAVKRSENDATKFTFTTDVNPQEVAISSHSQTSNHDQPYEAGEKLFDYNKWYCVTYVRNARGGHRGAIKFQYYRGDTPNGTTTFIHNGEYVSRRTGSFERWAEHIPYNGPLIGLGAQADGTEYLEDNDASLYSDWNNEYDRLSNNSYPGERARGYYHPGGGWNQALYVDGEVVYAGSQLANAVSFKNIGYPESGQGAPNQYAAFKGKIGPFAVWQKALTRTEIIDSYNAFKPYFYT